MKSKNIYKLALPSIFLGLAFAGTSHAQIVAVDPGVRGGAPGAGNILPALVGSPEEAFFEIGVEDFAEAEGVGDGIGPRFNLDNCADCHSQPAIGGTSPAVNPQIANATAGGAQNTIPSFITANGPVREARFKRNADGSRDGGVHALFVVSGREDETGNADACTIRQENFQQQVNNNNVVFRIPTPIFGAGMIENIPNATLVANLAANASTNAALGISGRFNRNGNDGTISRFGWKAQNQSLLLFSGEAYNVEMGISNELFQIEREENAACQFAPVPNDTTGFTTEETVEGVSAIEKFAFFMRFAAPPTPSANTPGGANSIARGRANFVNVGCAQCHTPTLRTTASSPTPGLSNVNANLFSDLAIHNMGPGLADDVLQGNANGDEFRTSPLWGLGQRIFFLHDGRTSNLRTAILAHRSNGNGQFPASEANTVVNRFDALNGPQTQDLFNFLRSL